MAADLSTIELKTNSTSSGNQTANGSGSAFLKRRASKLLTGAALMVPDEARVYLQKLDMPSIEFSDDQRARIVEAPTSYVNRTDEWGDLLAKVFSRQESAAIEFEGTGVFKKGAMRMKMHLRKSFSLLQYPLDQKAPRIKNGIVDWNLQYDKKTKVVRLSGQSQFASPANITMYLVRILKPREFSWTRSLISMKGDCVFDLVHRNIVVGVLRVPDYLLVPGLNTAVKFNAELNTEAFADQELLGSFLSTLMIWDPTWLGEGQEKYTFQVWGKSASINGTEIPWITKAVQGINDTVYVLSNSDNGTTDISHLASDLTLRDMQIDFSNLKSDNGSLTSRMLGGRLALNVRYPVAYSEFTMGMMTTTHTLEFVSRESNKTYARLEVTNSDRTTSWQNDFTTADGRVQTEKHLSVDLKNATWTILDSEDFANNMLRPLMNDKSRRVIIKGMIVMKLRTPLGSCTLDPILYAKSISIGGMSILTQDSEKATPELTINNIALTGGYPRGVNKYPHLEMTYDLQIRNFGDGKFRVILVPCIYLHIHYPNLTT